MWACQLTVRDCHPYPTSAGKSTAAATQAGHAAVSAHQAELSRLESQHRQALAAVRQQMEAAAASHVAEMAAAAAQAREALEQQHQQHQSEMEQVGRRHHSELEAAATSVRRTADMAALEAKLGEWQSVIGG